MLDVGITWPKEIVQNVVVVIKRGKGKENEDFVTGRLYRQVFLVWVSGCIAMAL